MHLRLAEKESSEMILAVSDQFAMAMGFHIKQWVSSASHERLCARRKQRFIVQFAESH